ncbi:Ribonuclease HII [compost metagenome]
MWSFEEQKWEQGFGAVCGLDEVGRGPLAGPVVAAAVVLPRRGDADFETAQQRLKGLTDSKLLSERQRERFYEIIPEVARAWAIAELSPAEIDRLNILRASQEAMRLALAKVRRKLTPDVLLIDGHLVLPGIRKPQEALVKGDSRSISIAAASVLAKVYRDRKMARLHVDFPDYGFDRHKGYPTREHLEALERHGLTPHHRMSFAPCARLRQMNLF